MFYPLGIDIPLFVRLSEKLLIQRFQPVLEPLALCRKSVAAIRATSIGARGIGDLDDLHHKEDLLETSKSFPTRRTFCLLPRKFLRNLAVEADRIILGRRKCPLG